MTARVVYRMLQAWARAAAAVVYRRIDVTEPQHADRDGPTILAANHGNALADIAMIVAKVRRFPHFLAAATWWKSRPARLLFRLGGVVPIYRRRDGGAAKNTSTFEACFRALADDAELAIFPEGEMHREPSLLRLRTGAARIALGAAADAKVEGIALVPVGLVYADRGRFRSDAEIHFGEPIMIDEWVDRYRAEPARTVHALRDELERRLTLVTVNNASTTDARLVERATTIVLADAEPVAEPYARHNALRRALTTELDRAGGTDGAAYQQLHARVLAHDSDLARLGTAAAVPLADAAVAPTKQRNRELLLLAPAAAFGAVVNGPTVLGAALAGRRARGEMWQATAKGVAGTLLSPVVWLGEIALLRRRIGTTRATFVVGAGAWAGMAALAWHDRWIDRRDTVWQARAAREQPELLAAARDSREEVRRCVDALLSSPVPAGRRSDGPVPRRRVP